MFVEKFFLSLMIKLGVNNEFGAKNYNSFSERSFKYHYHAEIWLHIEPTKAMIQ